MSLPDFLKGKNKNKGNKGKKKQDFKEKCLDMLENIRHLNEKRYNELVKTFREKYDKMNISKKLISGFYAQLVQEYNGLREAAGESITKTTKRVANHHRVVEMQEKLKQRADEIEKEAAAIKKTTKKVVNEVVKAAESLTKEKKQTKKNTKKETKIKTEEKTPEKKKKVVKKKPASKKKVTKKKVTKKAVTKKPTAKKAAKKTAKKVTKKTAKKTKKKSN